MDMQGRIETEEDRQGFYYIIPAGLIENGNKTEAILYGLITSLVRKEGYCFATNRYLAEKLKLKSLAVISNALSNLQKNGWIKIEIKPERGNSRKIWIYTPLLQKTIRGRMKNHKRSYEKSYDPDSSIKSIIKSNKSLNKFIVKRYNPSLKTSKKLKKKAGLEY